jgi:multidrug efflux pump subunit AcrB
MEVLRGSLGTIPGVRAVLIDPSQQGFASSRRGGFPIEVSIRGRDWDALARFSRQIQDEAMQTGLVTDVNSDYQVGMPEVRVVPDRNKAADLGVSMADIGQTINAAIGGSRVGKFKEGGRRFDIRGRLLGPQREKPEDINRLYVRAAGGGLVRLSELVRLDQQPTLQAITRLDRERAITVFANVAQGVSQKDALASTVALAQRVLPDGYRAVPAGSSQAFQESFTSLKFAFFMGLVVAYMVLAAQFNAFSHPLTVLLALPFSISGALFMLWAFGQSMNVYSMLGLILLMGIAKKNSIMLVDFTNQIRERGVERHEAIMQACPIRLRPILMTSASTIAGAIPPAFALGAGAETQRPMAIALIGGMLVSTALTLFVVPAFYSLLDDAVVWNEQRQRHGTGLVAGLRALRPRRLRPANGTVDDGPLG